MNKGDHFTSPKNHQYEQSLILKSLVTVKDGMELELG